MIFAAPWVLLALGALPLIWWLLRVTPPAPRSETFPAIRLLAGLRRTEETSSRTPWWLLALRMLASALVIIAIARPVLDAGTPLPGSGPVLLVMDDGWAAAAEWPRRLQAADAVLDRAERAGRPAALLTTAPDGTGAAPSPVVAIPVPDLRVRLAALRPKPWQPDRAVAIATLQGWTALGTAVVYIADGLSYSDDNAAFGRAMTQIGPVTELCCGGEAPTRVLLPPRVEADRLVASVAQLPSPVATTAPILAQSGDGRTLARVPLTVAAGAASGEAAILLPPELRNRLTRLVMEGPPSAAGVVMLDESWRRRPVGLVAGDEASADAPLTGGLYYLERALGPFTEVRTGDAATLLSRKLAVLILADRPLPEGKERDDIAHWVEQGGLLIRFAGPLTAAEPVGETDPLMPVHLLGGDRQLGGALSWSQPAALAPFGPTSPFAGLPVPEEVRVSRQILAEPSAQLASETWAALADGTPLVTQATRGAGRIVLFHVTANADWSNLPLSGLFPDMLRRLVQLSAGVADTDSTTLLAPVQTLDGYGVLGAPQGTATALAAGEFATTPASPRHPPGLYGPESGRRVLNLATAMPPLVAASTIARAAVEPLGLTAAERPVGPWLLALATALLAVDLLISLGLRGLFRRSASGATVASLLIIGFATLLAITPARALDSGIPPALATRLGYIVTGDAQVDDISRAGLVGLSEYVNRRTAATLVEPDAVQPGRDDLSFYPLLYWPVTQDAAPLNPAAAAALNDYTSRGGIILIDTRDSGSGFGPGNEAALQRVAQGLVIPPLAPLTTEHVLARSFYLLQEFSGRYTGDTVWVQRDQDRANDGVSAVIVGGNDWASAWAIDQSGRNPYAVIPGGARQRTIAYRFGVNLVIYALTGNYKGDQVHVPAILERLGQ